MLQFWNNGLFNIAAIKYYWEKLQIFIQFELKNNCGGYIKIHGCLQENWSKVSMKFYFLILCFTGNVKGGVWFGPKDGLGGDDQPIVNFMRPSKVFNILYIPMVQN